MGKTCLITRFVDDVFLSTNKSTIGVDFKATEARYLVITPCGLRGDAGYSPLQPLAAPCSPLHTLTPPHTRCTPLQVEMDGKAVQLQVWDTAGQEHTPPYTPLPPLTAPLPPPCRCGTPQDRNASEPSPPPTTVGPTESSSCTIQLTRRPSTYSPTHYDHADYDHADYDHADYD